MPRGAQSRRKQRQRGGRGERVLMGAQQRAAPGEGSPPLTASATIVGIARPSRLPPATAHTWEIPPRWHGARRWMISFRLPRGSPPA